MYNSNKPYPHPRYLNIQKYNTNDMFYGNRPYPNNANQPMYDPNRQYPYDNNSPMYDPNYPNNQYNGYFNEVENNPPIELKDYGPEPYVVNINQATKQNDTFRTALWTGEHLQLTLMSIDVGEDIGLEMHPNVDQFIRIEEGQGVVLMGDNDKEPNFEEEVYDDVAFIIPAGKWHNLINTGNQPLKLYSIYAPPNHPRDTVHETKEDAMATEETYSN